MRNVESARNPRGGSPGNCLGVRARRDRARLSGKPVGSSGAHSKEHVQIASGLNDRREVV